MNKRISNEKMVEARRQTADRKEREAREQSEQTVAYNASIKKSYTPDKETILAQLEELYADGKISVQEYDWGMAGLDVVHGYVAEGQAAEDRELPF